MLAGLARRERFPANHSRIERPISPGCLKSGLTLVKRRPPDLYSLSVVASIGLHRRNANSPNAVCKPRQASQGPRLGTFPPRATQLARTLRKPGQIDPDRFLAARSASLEPLYLTCPPGDAREALNSDFMPIRPPSVRGAEGLYAVLPVLFRPRLPPGPCPRRRAPQYGTGYPALGK